MVKRKPEKQTGNANKTLCQENSMYKPWNDFLQKNYPYVKIGDLLNTPRANGIRQLHDDIFVHCNGDLRQNIAQTASQPPLTQVVAEKFILLWGPKEVLVDLPSSRQEELLCHIYETITAFAAQHEDTNIYEFVTENYDMQVLHERVLEILGLANDKLRILHGKNKPYKEKSRCVLHSLSKTDCREKREEHAELSFPDFKDHDYRLAVVLYRARLPAEVKEDIMRRLSFAVQCRRHLKLDKFAVMRIQIHLPLIGVPREPQFEKTALLVYPFLGRYSLDDRVVEALSEDHSICCIVADIDQDLVGFTWDCIIEKEIQHIAVIVFCEVRSALQELKWAEQWPFHLQQNLYCMNEQRRKFEKV